MLSHANTRDLGEPESCYGAKACLPEMVREDGSAAGLWKCKHISPNSHKSPQSRLKIGSGIAEHKDVGIRNMDLKLNASEV